MEASDNVSLRHAITDAIRYWELRRIFYNVVLALVVLGVVVLAWPQSRSLIRFASLLPLFVLAVSANVCYATAYVVDVPMQLSDFRATWQRLRWLLWCVGTLFAAILAFYWMADEVMGGP